MKATGAIKVRLLDAWIELRENLGRSVLQMLGIVLGVASVLGGFSISDSQRRRSEELFTRIGGLDKLAVYPVTVAPKGQPTALQSANLGLRSADGIEGRGLEPDRVNGMSILRRNSARIKSPQTEQHRTVTGIEADFIPMGGYAVAQGRNFSASEQESGAAVVILGTEAAETFFPAGSAVGQTLTINDTPATVVGVFQERVFRFTEQDSNLFAGKNRLVAAPAAFVQKRLQLDPHRRVDQLTFRLPDLNAMQGFSTALTTMLKSNHRQQEDFRLDDIGKRVKKAQKQGEVYDLIFLLSGVLALFGGGIVNVNIQLASLKERIREVGLKMALGASDREVFKSFMTEALLLTLLGTIAGLAVGTAFSWTITRTLGIPLFMRPSSFLWSFLLAGLFGFVFALFPAWKASRLSPMEALRYE